ncbi:Zinc finger Ran-binding domain-containing protein 2 [Aphelenchoides fujianensis]|nr:Zinc finger Ran-binding domain-containing protein 2 [Aphelenchoides fujianensis]
MFAEESAEEGRQKSGGRRVLSAGEWACSEPRCAHVNPEKSSSCGACGRAKPRPKNKGGIELGKEAAEKSKGLFSESDWQCSKCGNVNWAKRNSCNICQAKKNADTEVRTGFGGGFNDRQNVEYKKRADDGEFDEFGRRKKKRAADSQDESSSHDPFDDRKKEAEEEESEEEDDDGDLGKYNFSDDDLADVKIDLSKLQKKEAADKEEDEKATFSSDCSCSCSGGECSCEESEEEVKPKRSRNDRSRSRERRSPRDRSHERSRHREDEKKSRGGGWDRGRDRRDRERDHGGRFRDYDRSRGHRDRRY